MRRQIIHGDGSERNALVAGPRSEPHAVVSVIDFGDMHHGFLVAEAAAHATFRWACGRPRFTHTHQVV